MQYHWQNITVRDEQKCDWKKVGYLKKSVFKTA